MLGCDWSTGCHWNRRPAWWAAADRAVTDGLATVTTRDRLVLTRGGRLLADAIAPELPLV
jgi:hypothetical protein